MNIEKIQSLVEKLDVATGAFEGVDPLMQTEGLEREIVAGVNRLICGVLCVPVKNESSLKKIDDVKAVVRKLVNLIGITTILNEDELLDDGLKLAMADRAERFLAEVMEAKEAVVKEVQSFVLRPDVDHDELILKRCNGGSWSHRSTGVRAGVLFNLMKENMGKCFTMDEFMEALKSCNIENHFGQLTKVSVNRAFGFLKYVVRVDEKLYTSSCVLTDLGEKLSKNEPRFKMERQPRS